MGNEPTCCQIGKWFHLTKQQSDGAKLSGHDPGTEQPGDNARWWFSEMFIFLWWGPFHFSFCVYFEGHSGFVPHRLLRNQMRHHIWSGYLFGIFENISKQHVVQIWPSSKLFGILIFGKGLTLLIWEYELILLFLLNLNKTHNFITNSNFRHILDTKTVQKCI